MLRAPPRVQRPSAARAQVPLQRVPTQGKKPNVRLDRRGAGLFPNRFSRALCAAVALLTVLILWGGTGLSRRPTACPIGDGSMLWISALLLAAHYCAVQAVRDFRARRVRWSAAGVFATTVILVVPIWSHAVKMDLPVAGR